MSPPRGGLLLVWLTPAYASSACSSNYTGLRGRCGSSDRVISDRVVSQTPPDGGEPEEHGDEDNETESQHGLQRHLSLSAMGPGPSMIINEVGYPAKYGN